MSKDEVKKDEIIIDGVNVKECPHRNLDCSTFMNIVKCYNYGTCKGQNCLYKQLQKSKKENEKLHNIIEQVRQEVEEDVTCESQECGCDDYRICLECFKNTILKIIKSEE